MTPFPTKELLAGLRAARGHGREDYPVERLWRVVLLTIALGDHRLRHTAFDACLAELHRSPALCRLIGISTEGDIPHGWSLSRCFEVLGTEPHLSNVRAVFNHLARRLGLAVPALGQPTAGSATTLRDYPVIPRQRKILSVQRSATHTHDRASPDA